MEALGQLMFNDSALEDESAYDHEKADSYANDGGQPDRDPAKDEEEQRHQA